MMLHVLKSVTRLSVANSQQNYTMCQKWITVAILYDNAVKKAEIF